MQRPIWKGHISFGLVSIPVILFSAEKRSDLHFHMLDSRNHARVHYERVNDETGAEVPWNEIVKAFEFDEGNYVILKDEDFKRAAPKAIKSIDIEDFVNGQEIDYRYFEKPYYIVPDKYGEKGYVLLREAMKKVNHVGIAKVVIRSKQYLAAVMVQNDALVLNLLRFSQELRHVSEFEFPQASIKKYNIKDKELNMAVQLINNMVNKWEPEKYHDEYREALMQWIEEKATTETSKEIKKTKAKSKKISSAKVVDFMELLQQSISKKGKFDKKSKPGKPKTTQKKLKTKKSGT